MRGVYNRKKVADLAWCPHDIDDIGDIDGPSVEYHLFRAGTGVHLSEQECLRAAERICTLERARQVRHWARDREMDEMVLAHLETSVRACDGGYVHPDGRWSGAEKRPRQRKPLGSPAVPLADGSSGLGQANPVPADRNSMVRKRPCR
jgi:hypothetical protein